MKEVGGGHSDPLLCFLRYRLRIADTTMAVQAQYPSNVLFFNRSLQDGKNPLTPLGNDYSFQNHAAAGAGVGGGGGAVIDQTQIRLNPADGSNSRKRAREHEMNPLMSMQSQQPKIIDLAQLHASPSPNLHARAAQLSAEAQAWAGESQAQEVTAATLQAQLQQVIMNAGAVQEREDGNSPPCGAGGDAEDAESAYIDPDRVVLSTGPSCKACRKRIASVVGVAVPPSLPLRRLRCGGSGRARFCLSVRSSSVEVFLC
nr:BOI-related E3 ubiquitin-protein ligase 1-like [Ipomoea batatas]